MHTCDAGYAGTAGSSGVGFKCTSFVHVSLQQTLSVYPGLELCDLLVSLHRSNLPLILIGQDPNFPDTPGHILFLTILLIYPLFLSQRLDGAMKNMQGIKTRSKTPI